MSRRGKAATDALRVRWRSGDFAGACAELAARPNPDAATLRRALSAREIGRACALPVKEGFVHALCLMAAGAPAALASRHDIAQQMRQNGSLRLALSTLCAPHGSIAGRGHLDDELLVERAVDALLALQPEAVAMPLARAVGSGSRHELSDKNEAPVWTRAPALPWRLGRKLIKKAQDLGPLDPGAAWTALVEHAISGARADRLSELASAARAPTPSAFGHGLASLAHSHYGHAQRKPDWTLAERLPLMEGLCRSHADMAGAVDPAAMLGVWTAPGRKRPGRAYGLGILPKRVDGRSSQYDDERASALSALDWFQACAELCASLGAKDLGALPTEDNFLDGAYASYRDLRLRWEFGRMAEPRDAKAASLAREISLHKFPTYAPTLAESFNVAKSCLEIESAAAPAARSGARRAL